MGRTFEVYISPPKRGGRCKGTPKNAPKTDSNKVDENAEASTFAMLSKSWKVTVETVSWKISAETMLTDKPGGCVVNNFDSFFVSPMTINSFCTAYTRMCRHKSCMAR